MRVVSPNPVIAVKSMGSFSSSLRWCLASVGLEAEKTRKHGMEVFEKTFHLS